jgi:acyl dehydratase
MSTLADLSVGAQIPTFVREGTLHHWNRFAAANDEYADHHMDDEAARHEGFPAAVGMGPLIFSLYHVLVRQWLGGDGWIVSVTMQLRGPWVRGHTMVLRGEITRVRDEDGARYVDLNVWGEDADGTVLNRGTAVVTDAPRSS